MIVKEETQKNKGSLSSQSCGTVSMPSQTTALILFSKLSFRKIACEIYVVCNFYIASRSFDVLIFL